MFGECGELLGYHIFRHKGGGKGHFNVIVRYKQPSSAEKALNSTWNGTITVSPARANAKWGGPY